MTAIGEVGEFIYQAMVVGCDKAILELMDITDEAWIESLKESGLLEKHDALKRFVILDIER